MKSPTRRRPLPAWVLVGAYALVVGGWLLHAGLTHRGEHFVAGTGVQGSLALNAEQIVDSQFTGASGSCFYEAERHSALVPIEVTGVGEGAMTFHVTATVQSVGGDVVESANSDVPFESSMQSMGTWVQVPMDQAAWDAGANDCQVQWTMSPGAWFSNDD